jgi:hypothetical protein
MKPMRSGFGKRQRSRGLTIDDDQRLCRPVALDKILGLGVVAAQTPHGRK